MKMGNKIMVEVSCSKEKELSEMHENISLIQKDVEYIRDSFDKELKYISKSVYGNGKKGLVGDVDDLNSYVDKQTAQFNMTKWLVGSGLLFSLISLFLVLQPYIV
jgi:hypothetical protein